MVFWDMSFETISLTMLLELMLRIVVAGLCGAAVGFERSKRFKEAGLRTHCVVALAAALFMIISKYGFCDLALYDAGGELIRDGFFAGTKGADPSRIASGIVSGVGFLGAGVIFKNGNVVRGITTAAGIWATSAIGMAFGSGMYLLGLFTTAFIMIVQIVMHKFPVGNDAYNTGEIVITMTDCEESRAIFANETKNALIVSFKAYNEGDVNMVKVTLKPSTPFTPDKMLEMMEKYPQIKSISM